MLSGWVTQEWFLDSGDDYPHKLQRVRQCSTKYDQTRHLKSYFSEQEIITTETSAECAYMYGETCPSGGSCVCAHAVGEFDSCQVKKKLPHFPYLENDINI